MTSARRSKVFKVILHPLGVIAAAVVYFLLVHFFDTRWRFMPYTFAVTLALASLVFFLSRRPVFSLYTAGIVIMLLTLLSVVKFRLKGLALHAYDFFFTGTDLSIIDFLWSHYRLHALAGGLTILLAAFFLIMLFRGERAVRVPLLVRLPLVPLFLLAAEFTHPIHNPREADYLPYVAGYNASALPLSLRNLPDLMGELPLAARVAHAGSTMPFAEDIDCGPARLKPDLFMVLSESQTAPGVVPALVRSPELIDTFRSGDGTIKPLFVETIGAGTWMTNFSVLTGLSTADFGWQAAYVTQLMERRIRGALPELLSRCGYRTVSVMPLPFNALNEGAFLTSIGFQEVIDAEALGMKPMTVRDRDYFSFIEKLVTEHRRSDPRPLFLHVQTMFAHQPYDYVLLPDDQAPPHDYDGAGEANEYLRRVWLARADLDAFLERRKAEPGPRGTVVAEFGDHHATVTRDHLIAGRAAEPLLTDFRSPLYETFYRIEGYGTPIDYGLLHQSEDAAFLSARVLAAANMPRSQVWADLLALSEACGGRLHTCPDRSGIDRHIKARIDGGLLVVN